MQHNEGEFLKLYQQYRYSDQLVWYRDRRAEFETAQSQAIFGSIIFVFLAAIAGIIASSTGAFWPKVICLLLAAVFPILSTALAAYSTLYAFEQQAKLYHDAINSLIKANASPPPDPDAQPGLSEEQVTDGVHKYVHEIENIFLVEQGQWGQLAQKMKASET